MTNRDRTVALPWQTGKNRGKPGQTGGGGGLHGCIKMLNTIGANRERCQKPGKTGVTP